MTFPVGGPEPQLLNQQIAAPTPPPMPGQAPGMGGVLQSNNMPAMGLAQAPINVSAEQQEELVRVLTSAIDYHDTAVKPLLDKADEALKMFNVIPQAKDKPWPNASNFPVPFVAEKLMSIHARLVRAIFNVDPLWIVKARAPEGVENAARVENFLDYLVDRGNYKSTLDLAILYALIEGTAIVKIDYKRVTRNVKSSNPQIAAQRGTLRPDGQTEEFTEFEGPRASYVPLRDFVVLPLDRADLDNAQGCGHRFFLSKSQLLQREKDGIYTNAQEVVDRKAQGDPPEIPSTPFIGKLPEPPSEVVESYALYEMYWHYDIDGTGQEVPVLITFSREAQVILRCIKYPYDHGKAPYVAIRPVPQPNLFYGVAFTQWLEPIQKELTASFQRRADALARATLPPVLRTRGSSWNPTEVPLSPGSVIDVNDPAEIQTLQLPDFRQSNVSHEQMLVGLGERITGISDYQLGRSPGQGRTFGEVRSVLAEGEIRIDVLLDRIHQDMRRIAELTFDIAYQFMPMGGLMTAGGQFFRVTPEMMRPPGVGYEAYEFLPNGTLSEASKEQKLERTMVLVNQFMQNPLLMNPQLNPQAPLIAALLMQKLLIEAGWLDYERYLPQLSAAGQQQFAQQQMQQQMQQQQAMELAAQQAQVDSQAKMMGAQAGMIKAVGSAAPQLAGLLQGAVPPGAAPPEGMVPQ